MAESERPFAALVNIMHRLRAPGGCPWDREQTHETLTPYLVEETYEVLEALESGSDQDFRDELGDVLLQVVFHAELAAERGAFTITDVIDSISAKLVRRHPHVFGDGAARSADEVKANWARIKAEERRARSDGETGAPSVLDGVPRKLPALLRAHRLGEKAAEVGFDWPDAPSARAKVDEELAEVHEAATGGDADALADEIGDLLFAVTSYARLSGVHAEATLHKALERFRRRFAAMEDELDRAGSSVHDAGAAELDAVWNRIKSR